MIGGAVLLLIHSCGIRGAGLSSARSMFGGFVSGLWVQVHRGGITGAGVAAWPYSATLLCEVLGPLVVRTWDTMVFLICRFLFSLSNGAGHRLVLMAFPISSVLVSEGIEIRQGCRFISSLVRALGKLSLVSFCHVL